MQTDGGYLGMDLASFISAIVSAAAGVYSVGMTGDRSIDIDLIFQPNQIVRVSASSTSTVLGTGSLTISRDSELTLARITVSAPIEVQAGALLTLDGVRFAPGGCVRVQDNSESTVVLQDTSTPPVCVADCGDIEHCVESRCVTSETAVCDTCEDGFYSYRHDDEPGHCKGNHVTLLQAGLTSAAGANTCRYAHDGECDDGSQGGHQYCDVGSDGADCGNSDAFGVFEFRFSGSVPGDLASGEVTVPASASLSLTGTGAETIGARITVDGSLSMADVELEAAAISVSSGGSASLSGCSGSLAELSVTDSTLDIDTSTSLTLGSANLNNAGLVALTSSTIEQTMTVTGDTQLSLRGCTLGPSATVNLSGGGGSLSLASMAVPAAVLDAAEHTLSGVGSTLRLDAVTVPEAPSSVGAVTWTRTIGAEGRVTVDAPDFGVAPVFLVTSGPCAVSKGGRCVGRPGGYGPREDCAITVGGGGGVLAPCAVFDLEDGGGTKNDRVMLPQSDTSSVDRDGNPIGTSEHAYSDCPVGVALAYGDALDWHSDSGNQGSVGTSYPNGCVAKGTCGLPYSPAGLGGGWELCFA